MPIGLPHLGYHVKTQSKNIFRKIILIEKIIIYKEASDVVTWEPGNLC